MMHAPLTMLAAVADRAGAAPAGGTHFFAAPGLAAPPSPGLGGLGEVTLALALVLAAIFALAWVVRRIRGASARPGTLDVLAEVRLGAKERAVLIKVGTQQVLVGVAPGQVSALHVLAEPIEVARAERAGAAERPTFASLLKRSLGKS